MKKSILLTMTLAVMAVMFSCSDDKEDFDVSKNNISLNGKVCIKLQSAFIGGGVSDPAIGNSFRFHLFSNDYSEYPQTQTADVVMSGVMYNDSTYSSYAECIQSIILNNAPNIGKLILHFTQGKYENDNENVKSAEIRSFSFEKNIRIIITTTSSDVIEILYNGKVLPDGMI